MNDIVGELRRGAEYSERFERPEAYLFRQAADEIERLRTENEAIRAANVVGRNIDNHPTLPISDELIQRQKQARELLEARGKSVDMRGRK